MSEVEKALADLLERETPGTVAPFVDVQRRARVRRRGRVAGAAALVVTVAVAGIVGVHGRSDERRPGPAPVAGPLVDGPPPERITHNGVALRLAGETPLHEVSVGRSDRSTLIVEAGFDAPESGGWHCTPFSVVRILAQDERSVRIGAYGYEPVDPPSEDSGCADIALPWKKHAVRLGTAVDGRTVLNGTTPVTVRDEATLLTPTYLPPGHPRTGELVWGLPTRAKPPEPAAYAQWLYTAGGDVFVYVRLADPAAERYVNSLSGQASVFGPEEAFGVETRPTVRGAPGVVFTYGPGLRCLRWRESPTLAVVVCSHRLAGPLPEAELVAVAESMRPGG